MTTASPSWALSRFVRGTIIARNGKVTPSTATVSVISEVAGNLLAVGHGYLKGYDAGTVRAILLDEAVTAPFPTEAPPKYAGK